MNIFRLLTKNNIRILKLVDKEALHIREIADTLNISPGSVHKLATILKKEGMIKEEKHKNRLVVRLNRDSPVIKQIKSIINFSDITNSDGYNKLLKIGEVGIYGSYSNGTNDSQSDIDIWLKTDKKETELRPIIREMERELNAKVNLLILTERKIRSLKANDPEFYTRLQLTSIGGTID